MHDVEQIGWYPSAAVTAVEGSSVVLSPPVYFPAFIAVNVQPASHLAAEVSNGDTAQVVIVVPAAVAEPPPFILPLLVAVPVHATVEMQVFNVSLPARMIAAVQSVLVPGLAVTRGMVNFSAPAPATAVYVAAVNLQPVAAAHPASETTLAHMASVDAHVDPAFVVSKILAVETPLHVGAAYPLHSTCKAAFARVHATSFCSVTPFT